MERTSESVRARLARALEALPRGRTLPDAVWQRRHRAMVARCEELLALARRREPGGGPVTAQWEERLRSTTGFRG